jgi:hypothetical protein
MPERRYLRPGSIERVLNTLFVRLGFATHIGRARALERRVADGAHERLDLDADRYLMAPRGETDWVRNIRVAGGGELRRRGKRERFRAHELPLEQRQPVIDAYLGRWGRLVRKQFAALPDAADHPVFRIEPEPEQPAATS